MSICCVPHLFDRRFCFVKSRNLGMESILYGSYLIDYAKIKLIAKSFIMSIRINNITTTNIITSQLKDKVIVE